MSTNTNVTSSPTYIATQGCELLSSTVGNNKELLLTDGEQAAICSMFARYPFFPASSSTLVSLVGTIEARTLLPLTVPDAAVSAWDPLPFPGFIVQILSSDLERIVGNTFTLTWTFASWRFGTPPVTQSLIVQLNKSSVNGTFIGVIPATVVSGKSRLSTPHLWRPASGAAPDTISITALASGMTAQARLLTHHDGAFKILWPALHAKLQEQT